MKYPMQLAMLQQNIGRCILWLLHCAAQETPFFDVAKAWIHRKANRGVFRTKSCVDLPDRYCIPIGEWCSDLETIRMLAPTPTTCIRRRSLHLVRIPCPRVAIR